MRDDGQSFSSSCEWLNKIRIWTSNGICRCYGVTLSGPIVVPLFSRGGPPRSRDKINRVQDRAGRLWLDRLTCFVNFGFSADLLLKVYGKTTSRQ